jgi:hypothetical protein
MSTLIPLELAKQRQDRYRQEAAADRLARRQQMDSRTLRAPLLARLRGRLSVWLYSLAAWLAGGTADVENLAEPAARAPLSERQARAAP